MKKIAIATPVYNEAKNIKNLIASIEKACRTIPEISFKLLIIDDSSPDGTANIAKEAANKVKSQNLEVEVFVRKKKDGFGRAYVAGFNKLLKGNFDYILQMDADLSHNPKYIKDFIKAADKGSDLIIGSRYIKGGGTPDWGLHRKILSRGGNLYSKIILSNKISDYTGGYNMYSMSLLKKIDVNKLMSEGYGFLIELKYRALLKASSVNQVAIIFNDREHGQSKLPKNTLIKNFLLVPRLKILKLQGKFN
jgi:dolichol-phosphate mannosyltransferase